MLPDFVKIAQQNYPTEVTRFQDLLKRDKLSHLYLLVGPSQSAKLAFSRYIAWQVVRADDRNALRIAENEHPDVHIVSPIAPSNALKVSQIRDLMPEFVTTTTESARKVFVLDAVETMTVSAANSLLKFIEEPAGPQLIMMLTENLSDVLPTIQSRAQIVHLLTAEINKDDIDSDWQKQTQLDLFKWFELMMQRRIESFAFIQTKIIGHLTNLKQQQLFLNWLHKLARDTIIYNKVDDEKLAFPNLVGLYKTLMQHYDVHQLVKASDAIFADDQLRKVNLSLQARLEKMTLEVIIALGE
ncbi:DNA polymerase III subunit delta' [Leuconostoc litchii]|uniref:DNA polymerase III subunit delta n=1 Tax=Leuconostoc litchii TaxID=1981069 RepID=A0A6P2CR85_9LACO|nr:DNA polymerase III subunit delta [Leuconostoc litchii]TYC47622.1 DNA polymerase III subunit delta [Leuconostoc litchii]GMA69670.1 DNA polymerase III subunit delta' [Leuconostoc litchii]